MILVILRIIMNDKLIIIKEIKLFINRYEDLIYNVNNKYKVLKNMIIDKMYYILEDVCYCNLLENNKRVNYQRRILCNIELLDYYFYKLLIYKCINKANYDKVSCNLKTILKLVYGWMK